MVKTLFCRSALVVLMVLVVGITLSHAGIKPYAMTVTPHISALIFEGNEHLDNSPMYGLSLGYNFSERWTGELTVGYSEIGLTDVPDQEVTTHLVRLDALYHFQPKEKIVPYFVIGAGGLTFDVDTSTGESDQDIMANYGFGIKFFTTDRLALRLDARHVMHFVADSSSAPGGNETTYQNMMLSAGIGYQIGGADEAPEKVVDADDDGIVDSRDKCLDTPPGYAVDGSGCPLDSDGDGVVDAEDLCAGTAAGVEVDGNGCELVAAAPVVTDADGDGVEDMNDKCPNTPAEVPVNAYGCPSDSDGDGVFDVEDDCPNTPVGTAVGPDGCGPDEVNIKLRSEDDATRAEAFRSDQPDKVALAALAAKESIELNIAFEPNRSVISPRYEAGIKEAAAFITAHPEAKIVVEGHTDSTGSSDLNKKLSQKRADTVRWIMVRDYGVNPKQVVAKGYGESMPIADNKTQEGRAKNRRVIMRVDK